jgi:hypothetical protein
MCQKLEYNYITMLTPPSQAARMGGPVQALGREKVWSRYDLAQVRFSYRI